MEFFFLKIGLLLFIFSFINSMEIRCYSGLKYIIGQDAHQDTENCDALGGFGEAYCYKFMEETQINEVVKMGCSSFFCNGIRNRCMETDLFGMKGTLCCCNDRHYCNSTFSKSFFIFIFFIVFFNFNFIFH